MCFNKSHQLASCSRCAKSQTTVWSSSRISWSTVKEQLHSAVSSCKHPHRWERRLRHHPGPVKKIQTVYLTCLCVCGVCSLQVILRATQLKHVKASHFLQWRVPAVDHIRAICTLHFPADPKCSAKPKGQKKLFHLWSRDLPGDKLYLNIFKPPSRRHVFGGPVRPWSYNQVKAPKRRGL